MKGIADRVAIVSGGATSVGAEIVRALVAAGGRAAAADIDAADYADPGSAADRPAWHRSLDVNLFGPVMLLRDGGQDRRARAPDPRRTRG